MNGIILLLLAGAYGWQTYTNANFVNDLAGNDSTVCAATNGGVVVIDVPSGPRTLRKYVNTDGLPANRCLCIARDTSGDFWVGTDGGGLAVIDADSGGIRQYRPNDLPLRITALMWDLPRLLVGTEQGLYVIDARGTLDDFSDDIVDRFYVARIPELQSDDILSLAVLGGYWVGTNRGVTLVDTGFGVWTAYRRPLGDTVRSMAVWHDSLLAATERGVALLGAAGFRPVIRFSQPVEAFDLAVSGSSIYLATVDGLYAADSADSARFELVLQDDSRALLLGRTVWVGCGGSEQAGSGLRYASSGQSWVPYFVNGIQSDVISDCVVRPSRDIYMCHSGSISWVTPGGEVSGLYGPLPVPVQVRLDSRGRAWFGHFSFQGGVSVYDPSSGEWQSTQWGDLSSWNIVDAFGIDRHDTKWVFNGGGVVVAIDSSGVQEVFDVPGLTPPPGGLYEFAFDTRSRAWLGLTVGLVMIDYAGTLFDRSDDRDTILSSGLPSSEVRSVAVDREDNVWVATPQGAARWDGSTFRLFTTGNSRILSSNVYRVRVDASDRVWFLTEAGLSIYDQVTTAWTNYTPQGSGLIANTQAISGFYSALDISNEIGLAAIGTQRGLSLFDYSIPAGSTAEHLRVYPNPCVLGVHLGLIVDSLPDDVAGVQIRTLEGRPVGDLSIERARHRAVWKPQDKASGIYLIVVTTPRGIRVERVALVRP
jgi:hypothetical protein